MRLAAQFLPMRSSAVPVGVWAVGLFGLAMRRAVEADALHFGWRTWLAMASVCFFLAFVVLIQRSMGQPFASIRFGEPRSLVTTGAFRFTRNPIYLAATLPMLGLAGYSLYVAVAMVAVYVVVMTRWVIAHEERCLRKLFGSEYDDYASRTPRGF